MDLIERLDESAAFVRERIGERQPVIAIILGSGLGDLADKLDDAVAIDYSAIPHFPVSTVPGHKGKLVIGNLGGKTIICMQGRIHYYEGWSMAEVVYPVQVIKKLGVNNLFLTNAAGCVNLDWKPGDLMIITDHIKLIADNPMRGQNEDGMGPRFFDMTRAYDKNLVGLATSAAIAKGIVVRRGVYMYFAGPNFETPAEIRFARMAGADAVGMSTVPEAIAAAHLGMRTLGISCLTNMAAGILDQPLSHQEVLDTGAKVKKSFTSLVKEIIKRWA